MGVELIVLGASGSWPGPGGATSGYLLTHERYNLWIEMGTGTLARLQEHVSHAQVHAAVISHSHPDHYVDLHTLFYARWFHHEPLSPLPVFLPSGAFDRISCAVGERTAAAMRETFDVREVDPGASFDLGPFRLHTRPMRHTVPTLGLRVEADGQVMAYTADTAPTDEIEVIARESALLLAEATYLEVDQRAPLHLSARQAGEFAARSATARLVLTHVWPTIGRGLAANPRLLAAPDAPVWSRRDEAGESVRTRRWGQPGSIHGWFGRSNSVGMNDDQDVLVERVFLYCPGGRLDVALRPRGAAPKSTVREPVPHPGP